MLGKDKNGKEREPKPVVLAGSKEAVAFLIDNNHRQQKYTSGVIAFRDNEKPTPQQIKELLKDFRQTFLPGLDEDRCPILIVRHLEKGNLELHFLVAKQDAKTGKALNIAPPGAGNQKLFEDFQKIQNDKMGFKKVAPNLLKSQFDVFEKHSRKAKIGDYLVNKVKNNELHTYSDLLRHLEQDLKIKVTRRGKDFISVKFPNKEKAVRLQGPAFTPGADLRELLKQSDTSAERLTPEKKEQVLKSLENGIKQRTAYNQKIYNTPNKNRGLNFKSNSKLSNTRLPKTTKNKKIDMPKVAASNSIKDSLKSDVPETNGLKTTFNEPTGSTHTNPSTSSNKAATARSGGSASGSGGGGSSIDAQINSLKAKMNSEKDPVKRAILHSQLLALQAKKEEQLRMQHNDNLKRLNKIKP